MRTGLGGQKVVLNGGAFVLPIVHDVIPVNMNTLRLEVSARPRQGADHQGPHAGRRGRRVLCARRRPARRRRRRRADAGPAHHGARAAEGAVEGKFVDALRTAAAEMTMEELHEKRGDYVKRVREAVAEDLTKNGLELEPVSLTQLDQTNMEFFNPSNAFDAEGLTRLTEQIEQRKKQRNDIEQDTLIEIRNKNLEAEKLSLDIDRDSEYARLQERELEIARARQRAEVIDRTRAARAGRPRARRSPPSRRSSARASARADARAGAHRQGAHDPGAPRSSAAWRSSWPSSSAPSPIAQREQGANRGPGRGRDRPAPRPSRPRRRCSPPARSRWPSARRRSS